MTVTPLDSYRSRIYLAQLGLWLTLDAGTFQSVEINSASGDVRLGFADKNQFTPDARLRIAQPAKLSGVGTNRPSKDLPVEREDYVVPLSSSLTWVSLVAK